MATFVLLLRSFRGFEAENIYLFIYLWEADFKIEQNQRAVIYQTESINQLLETARVSKGYNI